MDDEKLTEHEELNEKGGDGSAPSFLSAAPKMPLDEEDDDGIPVDISDRWEIVERIGEGGMSVVYRGRHKVMNKVVAVKILLPHLTARATSLRRFQQEAQAVSALDHINLIGVLDCGITKDGQAYQVMDYIEGYSLTEIINHEGILPPERAIRIFMQTCKGLSHAHARGIIHRDLKPSNIMLVDTEDGRDQVRIVDFGLAKILFDDIAVDQNLTQTGEVFGSPLYMSPEQCTGSPLDERSDLYSLGCLMYETLTGKPPIVGLNVLDTMQRQLTDIPEPIANADSDRLTKRLNDIIFRCLAKESEDRYDNAEELHEDLRLADEATDKGWRQESSAAKNIARIRRRAKKKAASARDNTIPLLVAVVAMAVIVAWSFSLRTSGADNIKQYLQGTIWQEKVSPRVPESVNFESQERNSLRALGLQLQTYGEYSTVYVNGLMKVGQFYMVNGHWSDAIRNYQLAIHQITESSGGVNSIDLAEAYTKCGICYYKSGDFKAAKLPLSRALDVLQALNRSNPPTTGQEAEYSWHMREALECLEAIDSRESELNNAASKCEQILHIYNEMPGHTQDIAFWTSENADVLRRLQDYEKSEKLYREAQDLWSKLQGDRGAEVAKAEFGLGLALAGQKKYAEACQWYLKALPIAKGDLGYDDILSLSIAHEYSDALWKCDPIKAVMMRVNGSSGS